MRDAPWRVWWTAGMLLFMLSWAGWAGAEQKTVHVRWVVDGDTVILDTGRSVRLMGIDAPELGRDDRPGQYFAHQARRCALELMQDKDITLNMDLARTDRFHRLVALVRLPDGRLVNRVLVAKGMAFVCVWGKTGRCPRLDVLLTAQHRAMRAGSGLWSRILHVPAAHRSYVGNRRSKRFHTQDCVYGRAIHAGNKRGFSSLRQAFWAGFAPGRNCTPWPTRRSMRNHKGEDQ